MIMHLQNRRPLCYGELQPCGLRFENFGIRVHPGCRSRPSHKFNVHVVQTQPSVVCCAASKSPDDLSPQFLSKHVDCSRKAEENWRSSGRADDGIFAAAQHATRRDLLASSAGMLAAAALQGKPAEAAAPEVAKEMAVVQALPTGASLVKDEMAVVEAADSVKRRLQAFTAGKNTLGLQPANLGDLHAQVNRAWAAVNACQADLDKYQALMLLRDTESDLFLVLCQKYTQEVLPLLYTPTVAEACMQWSALLRRSPGLYISLSDKRQVQSLVNGWPEDDVKIAVLTDGERILGLGDVGVNGMGIPVGKSTVYAVAAGIDPRQLLPISLDTGCDVESVRESRFYCGLPRRRARGRDYDELVAETVAALQARYGRSILIHWEDFASRNSYRLLQRYREEGVTTFNDDIESTAAAVVAAVMGAVRLDGVPPLSEQCFVFVGAGQAVIGSARLLSRALQDEGLTPEEARRRMWLHDSKGLVYEGRQDGVLTPQKLEFARSIDEGHRFAKDPSFGVEAVGATAIIGAAAQRGTITRPVLQAMNKAVTQGGGKYKRPIVMALSNPKENAECTAQEAYDFTDGNAVFASGTSFDPVHTEGKERVPAQANNSFIFPGLGLGAIASGATQITDSMMLAAARAVAATTTSSELRRDSVLPDGSRIREVAVAVAAAVAATAKAEGVTSSAALACLSDLGRSQGRNEDCLVNLQYDPIANWQTSHRM